MEISLNFESVSGCLCLSQDGAYSVFASSWLFFVSLYLAQAKTLKVSSSEMEELKQKFEDLPGSSVEKLKDFHSEVFLKVSWGRLVVFLNFADQLGLTEEEWKLLLFF